MLSEQFQLPSTSCKCAECVLGQLMPCVSNLSDDFCFASARVSQGQVYAETVRRLGFSFREASEFLSVFLLLGVKQKSLEIELNAWCLQDL